MNRDHFDPTIDRLCTELTSCGRLKNPLWRSSLWSVIAILYVVVTSMLVGLQPGTADRLLFNQHYLFELGLSLLTGITASAATFILSVPDIRSREWFISVPGTMFFVHFGWMASRLLTEGTGEVPSGWFSHCWMDSMLMTALPCALVFLLIRKGATVSPRLLAFNAVLAVASFGWIGIRLICPFETIGKAYFVNFLPFLVLGSLTGLLARRIFRW